MFIRLLKWMMFAMSINVTLTPWETSLAKTAGYATIILTFLATLWSIRGKNRIQLNKGTVGIFILFLAMCAGMIVDVGKLKFDIDYIKMAISFFSLYILVNTEQQTYKAKDLRDIFRINKLLSCVYILYTFYPFDFRYTTINKWGDMAFTMNMGNTNATSVLVMFCIALLCLELKNEKKRFFRIVDMAMILALMYTLYKLQSRTAIVSMLLIIVCVWLRRFRFRPWYNIAILLMPIVYFGLQIALRELEGVMILGKELNTGRGEMFLEYFNELKAAPWKYIVGSTWTHQFANYHNAPIAIVSNFGFVGLIGFLLFWHHQLKELTQRPEQTMFQVMAVITVCAFLVHSSAEASPMLGGIPYSSAVVLLVRLAKDRFEEPATEAESLPVNGQNRI